MNSSEAFSRIVAWVEEPDKWHPRVRSVARATFPLSFIVHGMLGTITVAFAMVVAVVLAVFWTGPRALLSMYDDPEPDTPHDDGFGGL